MSYDNKKYNLCPSETMCLTLIDKGLIWHQRSKLFEDCYGVLWPEKTVFAIINKVHCQKMLSIKSQGIPLKKIIHSPLSLRDRVTHLSLQGFDEYAEKMRWIVINE